MLWNPKALWLSLCAPTAKSSQEEKRQPYYKQASCGSSQCRYEVVHLQERDNYRLHYAVWRHVREWMGTAQSRWMHRYSRGFIREMMMILRDPFNGRYGDFFPVFTTWYLAHISAALLHTKICESWMGERWRKYGNVFREQINAEILYFVGIWKNTCSIFPFILNFFLSVFLSFWKKPNQGIENSL